MNKIDKLIKSTNDIFTIATECTTMASALNQLGIAPTMERRLYEMFEDCQKIRRNIYEVCEELNAD